MTTHRQGFRQAAREELPEEQQAALKSAIRWQIFTISYTICTITVVAFVLGGSQAMTTAWIEDILSLLPQISFFVALIFTRRRPTKEHPYGWHRAMGVGHLLAGAALVTVGGKLGYDSIVNLLEREKVEIPTTVIFGHSVWFGWIMIGVMAVVIIGPVFLYGPAKSRLAPVLHNKLLFADADMAKADWLTNVASIVGVLGIGAGFWWVDGAAALFISIGIVRDGIRNCVGATQDLMDRRARTCDDTEPHPLAKEILQLLAEREWIVDAGIRLRDQGQVLHVEVFVTPTDPTVSLEALGELSRDVSELDWKVQDVVIVPTDPIPSFADQLVDQR